MSSESGTWRGVEHPALTERVAIDPGADPQSWRRSVPAKAACYALLGEGEEPLLLATVGDLRRSLLRRLGESGRGDGTSRKVDYAAVVRAVRWRPVFSRFEAEWAYLENARTLFPGRYRELVKRWRSDWIGIDLSHSFPRLEAKKRPFGPAETCFGPFPTAAAARKRVETLEDLFDLCRYPHILEKAPHGEACAYKEMGRCPAPCDGSVSMEAYREQLREAVAFLVGPREPWIERKEAEMRRAAEELAFERAQRCKSWLERAREAAGEGEQVRPLSRLRFLLLLPGDGKWRMRAVAVEPGRIRLVEGPWAVGGELMVKDREQRRVAGERLAAVAEEIEAAEVGELGRAEEERIGLVSRHLLDERDEAAVLLPAEEATEAAVERGIDRLQRMREKPTDQPAAGGEELSSGE